MLRLQRRADIHSVLHQGARFFLPWGVAHARPRGRQDAAPRVAFFTTRGFPGAVSRNRARRLVREALRVALAEVLPPWDVIFVLRPQVLTTTHPARLQTIRECLRQLADRSQEAAAST